MSRAAPLTAKRISGLVPKAVRTRMLALNAREAQRAVLYEDTARELHGELTDDLALLMALTGQNLDAWRHL